jgi:tetratricopeptide (TPR) repeat protein
LVTLPNRSLVHLLPANNRLVQLDNNLTRIEIQSMEELSQCLDLGNFTGFPVDRQSHCFYYIHVRCYHNDTTGGNGREMEREGGQGKPTGLARKSLADYQRGVDLVSAGHHGLAVSPLENCVHLEEDFTEARLLLIRIFRRLGRYNEALPLVRGILEAHAGEVELLLESVPVCLFGGQPSLALRCAWRIWEHLPTMGCRTAVVPSAMGSTQEPRFNAEVDLRVWLVLISLFEKGPRAGHRAVQACLDRDPVWLKGHFLRAGILELLGNFTRAEDAYARILEIDPSQSQPLVALRRLWRGATMEKNPFRDEYIALYTAEAGRLLQEDPSESISQAMEMWLGSFPEARHLIESLVNEYVSMGRHSKALEVIDRIPSQNLTLDLLCHKAEVMEGAGDTQEAAALFHAILAQDPHQKRACEGIVRLGSALENFQQAILGIERALEQSPEDPNLWYTKALLLKQRGSRSEMVMALEEAVCLDPRHQGVLYALGMERLHQKRAEEAALLFGDLVVLDPENQDGWRNLAIAQTHERQWEEALGTWRRLLALAPGDPQAMGNITRLEQFLLQCTEVNQPRRERND